MNKKKNYLEFIPKKIKEYDEEKGKITIILEHKGIFNKIVQHLLAKPKVSYIHLDDYGSQVWKIIDGEKDIIQIGKELKQVYGDEVEPLYERLSTFIRILELNKFISIKK